MKLINKFIISALAAASLAATGCKKEYLDTTPSSEISDQDLFTTTKNAYTLLNGMHRLFVNDGAAGQTNPLDFGQPALNMCQDIMAEDIVIASNNYDWAIYHYQYVATQGANYWMPYNYWTFFYKLINNANHIIDKVDDATGSDQEKKDLKGQAYAYRAHAYFMLVNLFSKHYNSGDLGAPGVPLYTEPTTATSPHKGRGTVGEVYTQILSDINNAVELLKDAGMDYADRKDMISLPVARGIYARIALTIKDYPTAAIQAELAKSQYGLMKTTDLTAGFNTNTNTEWMWSSALTGEQYNSRSLSSFLPWMDEEGAGYASVGTYRNISKSLYDKIDAQDVRKEWWKSDYKQKKFKLPNKQTFEGNDLLMRVAEMYLIEAEAKYYSDPAAAQQVLEDLVSSRYSDPTAYTAPTGAALLEEIYLQRRIELWCEGQAYFDILRLQRGLNRPTGTGNHNRSVTGGVLSLQKNDGKFLFKIPQREIDANDEIGPEDQN